MDFALNFSSHSTLCEKPSFKYPKCLIYKTRAQIPQEGENLHCAIWYSSVHFYHGREEQKKEREKDSEKEA